jgi:DNA-binding MarR family transcriptional regulator
MSKKWFIQIDSSILTNKDLSNSEKILYGLISNLESMEGSCIATNKYLSEFINVSPTQISILISNLVEKNLICRKVIMNDNKQIIKRILNTNEYLINKRQIPYSEKNKLPIKEKTKENRNINIKEERVNKIKIR